MTIDIDPEDFIFQTSEDFNEAFSRKTVVFAEEILPDDFEDDPFFYSGRIVELTDDSVVLDTLLPDNSPERFVWLHRKLYTFGIVAKEGPGKLVSIDNLRATVDPAD
ncbi:hypothetical protein [Paenibacillus sp. P22]|uniref:hypothetical protein n=1 Tax=Paenibacillus sp. P22 TaxID=483908 RepID=UPI00038F4EE6|nr:hypothetical protein [Paenibacillus sp. P22]CDN42007.1 hypothetical protein BN871_AT_00090 [Paenibacillus sp. P22]